MIKHVFFFSLLFVTHDLFSQNEKQLTLSKNFWGYKYHEGGNVISKHQAIQILGSNQEALKLFAEGNSNLAPAFIFSFAGGFMIGWPIGESLAGKKDPQWGLAAGGLALAIVGGAFEKSFQKKAKQSFELYNKGVVTSSVNMRIGVTGFELTYRF